MSSAWPFPGFPGKGSAYHHTIRPEGHRVLGYVVCFWRGIAYLRKYFDPNLSCSPEETAYFAAQGAVQTWLRGQPIFARQGTSARLLLVGDLMWLRDSWETFLGTEADHRLQSFDALLGNLETVISPRFPVRPFWPDRLRFNSEPGLLDAFRRASGGSLFAALSTANNHVLDYGVAGAEDTLDLLHEKGIPQSGLHPPGARAWVDFAVRGIRVGFFAATYGLNREGAERPEILGVNRLPGLAPESPAPVALERVAEVLAEMEGEGIELKIISLHWGFEFEGFPTPRMVQTAHRIVSLGADVIMGHHPHLPQPMEVCFVNGYPHEGGPGVPSLSLLEDRRGRPRKAIVCYSLGNFTTTMLTDLSRTGLAVDLRVFRSVSSGEVDWSLGPLLWAHNVGPRLRRANAARGRTRRLILLSSPGSSAG